MNGRLDLTLIADTHHYSRTLGDRGGAYELRSGSDQKCLAETGALIDAAFRQIAQSDTDAVLIAGDLTNNGERVCHEELRQKLLRLREYKPVYVITATHDWCCNGNPCRFSGDQVLHDVPVMSSDELPGFYREFGPGTAQECFYTAIGTVSYVVQLNDRVRLLALNDDQNGRGGPGYTEEHLRWIERQLQRAREDGVLLIGMAHHLIFPHIHPLLMGGTTCVADWEATAARLADAGLRLLFAGHSHIQNTDRFLSPAGNALTEVNIGSLTGYPAPIVRVTVERDNRLSYRVEHLNTFTLRGVRLPALPYVREHTLGLVHRVLESTDRPDFKKKLTALGLDGERLAPLYPIARPLLRFLREGTVGMLYRRLSLLGLTGGIDRELIRRHDREPLLELLDRIFLSYFDGGMNACRRTDDAYRLIQSFARISVRLTSSRRARDLYFILDRLLTGGPYRSQALV